MNPRLLWGGALVLWVSACPGGAASNFGGGPRAAETANCVPAGDALAIQTKSAAAVSRLAPSPQTGPAIIPYPFVPIAGTVWDDRFINNYVDLDSSGGILDWDCTDWTYDGHTGHDIDLRTFGEMDAGVPVFAALDGTVTDAHDFEFDRNTSMNNQPANYVVLFHGGTQYTWYYHLRRGSVAVVTNQFVKAGTQIGLAGSSGNSTGPHLHFESRNNGTWFEPSTGNCHPGTSDWVSQIPIRRDTWIEDFGMHNAAGIPDGSFFPYDPPRAGTFVRSSGYEPVGGWYVIHNEPANTTWRARYLRPDHSVFFDSGTLSHSNSSAYRYASWWFYWYLTFDTNGTWSLELSINGQVMVNAPFLVLGPGGIPTNHPPLAVAAAFDPATPATNNVVFCRLTVPLLEDPDYDLMRYRFQWKTNGVLYRDVTNAAHADAVPHGVVKNGDVLTCTATPYDGTTFGPPVTIQNTIGGALAPQLSVQILAGQKLALSWPTSAVNFVLESNHTLAATGWQTVTNLPAIVNGRYRFTNGAAAGSAFFRLKSS